MSKFNMTLKIERLDDGNEFLTYDVAACEVKALPIENIEKLIELIVSEARKGE